MTDGGESAVPAKPAAKTKAAKPKKAKKPSDHPKYGEMIKAAISSLKERSGSSRQAIVKYVKANYKVDDKCNTYVKLALKMGVNSGKFAHTKGVGASGSFKLASDSKEEKKPKKKSAKKPAAKKAAAKKSPSKKPKKAAAKKPAAAKPKKAKKSPAKKKAKKPAAKKAAKPKKK